MNRIFIATAALGSLFAAVLVIAQTRSPQPLQDEVPKAALLTERGAELAERLKWLRRSEDSMGKSHPSLPEVRQQIDAIREQLKAWAPAPEPNTYEAFDPKRKIPKMNDEDIRQMLIELTEQVADLKTRVARLERRE